MRIKTIIHKKSIINGCIVCLLIPSCVYAGLNKWEDDKGQIHYGDRVPTEFLGKQHSILNEQGVTVHTSEAMKSNEEIEAEQLRLQLENEENTKRIIAERIKLLRDRVLLDTFTTESDLQIARKARIEAIDSQIYLVETLIKNDKITLEKVNERIVEIEKSGRKPPINLSKKVVYIGRQLESNKIYVEEKKQERINIIQTFEYDLKRFKELKKARQEYKDKKIK